MEVVVMSVAAGCVLIVVVEWHLGGKNRICDLCGGDNDKVIKLDVL